MPTLKLMSMYVLETYGKIETAYMCDICVNIKADIIHMMIIM